MADESTQAERQASTWPRIFLFAVFIAAGIGGIVVIQRYGGQEWGIQFFAGLLASLLAFTAALMFENDREARKAAGAEGRRAKSLTTEIRRRLEAVDRELKVNAKSLKDLGVIKTDLHLNTLLTMCLASGFASAGRKTARSDTASSSDPAAARSGRASAARFERSAKLMSASCSSRAS